MSDVRRYFKACSQDNDKLFLVSYSNVLQESQMYCRNHDRAGVYICDVNLHKTFTPGAGCIKFLISFLITVF